MSDKGLVSRHNSLHQLAAIFQSAVDAIISIDELGSIESVNPATEKLFGYAAAELIGQNIKILMPEPYRREHNTYMHQHQQTGKRKIIGIGREVTGQRKDGSTFPLHISVSEYEIDGMRHFAGIAHDLSEQKRAQEESRRQQEALRRSQRLDALGQLTGGIAHDFNNLLTIIIGNLELAEGKPEAIAAAGEPIQRASEAAQMGARLTGRLLSFSRQRKLEPTVINLNEQILNMSELLQRTLGETIDLSTTLASDLWSVRVDPSEIENAVVNLAINARDAMPHGGMVNVETSNIRLTPEDAPKQYGLSPGDYIRITVSDTGSGMSPEVVARAFEPFFTTKGSGRGTGLGLASIYGFVKQSGGNATIYSELGRGTTVNLYLPRHSAGDARAVSEPASAALIGGGETVLVVEDSAELRALTLDRLQRLGYRVIEADCGPTALAKLNVGEKIDLIFSDVVMPGGLTGYELAARVHELFPSIRVLLTSGYDANLAAEQDTTGSNLKVLRKPYRQADLGHAVREALDR